MEAKILRLNKLGLPVAWISKQEAATLYAKSQIIWSLGNTTTVMLGGLNKNGERSKIDVASIIACHGVNDHNHYVPPLTNALLFRRDMCRCMYCGEVFSEKELTRDHIVPRVQQGPDIWSNVVAACKRCNNVKGGRTPEQAGMELLAVPFVPNVFEFMYLSNRIILGDQMEYLEKKFSSKRCWLAA